MTSVRRSVLVLLALALVVPASGAPGAEAETISERLRAMLTEKAIEFGVDPAEVFDATVELRIDRIDGSVDTYDVRFGDVLENMVPPGTANTAGQDPLAGEPEVLAGNTTHVWGDARTGTTQCGTTISTSDLVPATPFVPVTLAPLFLTPVPGALAPVIPPTSWILPAYLAGGPVRNVTGDYVLGFHTVGTLIGSAASTAPGASSPYPIWLPMVDLGFVDDTGVDFVGQAEAFSSVTSIDFFGFQACFGLGGMLLSTGAALFNERPVVETPDPLDDIVVGFPTIPDAPDPDNPPDPDLPS